jgi:hypothetical protein
MVEAETFNKHSDFERGLWKHQTTVFEAVPETSVYAAYVLARFFIVHQLPFVQVAANDCCHVLRTRKLEPHESFSSSDSAYGSRSIALNTSMLTVMR